VILDEITSTLYGVIVGAIIGFVASYLLWYLQERSHRKNVMCAFIIEIKRLEPVLLQASVILQKIQKIESPKSDQFGDDEKEDLRFQIYQELKFLKLYTDSGNWYVLKKDAYSLDPQISSELDKFYYNLIEAEFNREKYLNENYRDRQEIFLEPLTKNLYKTMNSHLKIRGILVK